MQEVVGVWTVLRVAGKGEVAVKKVVGELVGSCKDAWKSATTVNCVELCKKKVREENGDGGGGEGEVLNVVENYGLTRKARSQAAAWKKLEKEANFLRVLKWKVREWVFRMEGEKEGNELMMKEREKRNKENGFLDV